MYLTSAALFRCLTLASGPNRLSPKLKETLDRLRADTFVMDKVNNHDPGFGYNSFEGFIEEDCVQAIEQVINEKFNVEVEAHKRWE